jgi:hypothetical protein
MNMTVSTGIREQATPGASSQSISQRLRALSVRPEALTVQQVIDRYMAQYAGQDPTRTQRLSAWVTMIGEFTLEQVDSDLVHVCRSELQTTPRWCSSAWTTLDSKSSRSRAAPR